MPREMQRGALDRILEQQKKDIRGKASEVWIKARV